MTVRRSGPVGVTGPVPVPGPVPGLPSMTGLASMTGVTQHRLWMSHGIQDARNLRLQHLHNSHPDANAKYPQPRQSATSSSLIRLGAGEGHRGQGIGRQLLDMLIRSTEAAGIWTIQSGIFPENTASAALHRAAGFRTVGTRERIGQHHGRWRDVVFIERRSPLI